ncbi:unnamed protein product [Symbiodinium sp. CCMP2592]|nr:unnamed protein product [Symbiodinium sp. CCMP2592]
MWKVLLILASAAGASEVSQMNGTDGRLHSLRGRMLKQPVNLQIICGLDITGAVGAVGQVGAAAHFVHRDCQRTDTPQEKAACSTGVNALIARTMFLATFITSAAATCADTFNVPVFCAHSAFELTGSLGLISTAASAFQLSCGTASLPPQERPDLPFPLAPAVRRLQNQSENEKPKLALLPAAPRDVLSSKTLEKINARLKDRATRKAELSDCVFTSLVLSQFAIRGGVLISGAVQTCKDSANQKDACMTDLSGVLGSFVVTGALISLVASECPVGKDFKALCATDVLTMVSAIAFLFESVGKMQINCDLPAGTVDQVIAVDDELAGFV